MQKKLNYTQGLGRKLCLRKSLFMFMLCSLYHYFFIIGPKLFQGHNWYLFIEEQLKSPGFNFRVLLLRVVA